MSPPRGLGNTTEEVLETHLSCVATHGPLCPARSVFREPLPRKDNEPTMANLYRKPIIITDPKTGERVKAKAKKWWGRYKN